MLFLFFFFKIINGRKNSMHKHNVIMYNRQCVILFMYTVKPTLSGHSKRTPKMVFNTDYRLMQVKSIAECSKGSVLQHFRPSLSYMYHSPLRPLFCLFLRQGLLYLIDPPSTKCRLCSYHKQFLGWQGFMCVCQVPAWCGVVRVVVPQEWVT